MEFVSRDGNFIVRPAERTITGEEIVKIAYKVADIIRKGLDLYRSAQARDVVGVAEALKEIYEDIIEIKKMVED